MRGRSRTSLLAVAELYNGLPEPKESKVTKATRYVIHFWAERGASVYSSLQDKVKAEENAGRVAVAFSRSALARDPGDPIEFVRRADNTAIVIDRTHPIYWQNPAPAPEFSEPVNTVGNGGEIQFRGKENPSVADFFAPTPSEIQVQTTKQQS